MDLHMTETNGIEATRQILRAQPGSASSPSPCWKTTTPSSPRCAPGRVATS
jgi:hypothetical protein